MIQKKSWIQKQTYPLLRKDNERFLFILSIDVTIYEVGWLLIYPHHIVILILTWLIYRRYRAVLRYRDHELDRCHDRYDHGIMIMIMVTVTLTLQLTVTFFLSQIQFFL